MNDPNSHSVAYDVGYTIGYFVGGHWPYLIVGLAGCILLIYKIKRKKAA